MQTKGITQLIDLSINRFQVKGQTAFKLFRK